MRRLRSWRLWLAVTVLALGGAALGLWLTPSNQYLLLPDEARPVAPLVEIENERPQVAPDGAGIYMVDILVRRASLLEELVRRVDAGDATLVDARALNPHGVSEQQRRQTSSLDMTRSQQIAAAVALESLGYDVEAKPSGAEIETVIPDTPASGRLQPGDVIVRANGRAVRTPGDLRDAMAGVAPGEEVTIAFRRSGKLESARLTTQADPDDASRAVIGVIVQQAARIRLPVDISIDAGSIGGPSAGLAFALDIVDELGGDVDKGRRIVATGELGLDGEVGAIGGIKQKAIGAREAGADVFVVPEANAKEAREHAGGLEVVAVGSFDEALDELGAEVVTS
jgi:PDZ domain-containing protein